MVSIRLISVCLLAAAAGAGCPVWNPDAEPDGTGHAYVLDGVSRGSDLACAADGGLFLAGDAGSERTMGVAKLDPDGNVAWSRVLAGMATPYPEHSDLIAADEHGGALAVGSRKWLNGVDGEPQRIMLHRIDADGNTVWQGPFGPDNHHPTACIRSGDGFAIAARGFSYLPGDAGDLDPYGFSAFVARIADDGAESWRTALTEGDLEAYPRALAETADGGIVAAARYGPSRDAAPYTGAGRVAVFRLSTEGDTVWSKIIESDAPDDYAPCAVAVGAGGGIWVAGTRSTVGVAPADTSAVFVMRLTHEGDLMWQAEDPGAPRGWLDSARACDLAVHPDGRAAVTGMHSWSVALEPPWLPAPYPLATRSTPFLLQLDADGQRLWHREFGAGAFVNAMVVSPQETYVICGGAGGGYAPVAMLWEADLEGELREVPLAP